MGRMTEHKKTQNKRSSLLVEDDLRYHDISTWIPDELHELETMEQGVNPYENRRVGKTLRVQIIEEERDSNNFAWVKAKWPSCSKGFKRIS